MRQSPEKLCFRIVLCAFVGIAGGPIMSGSAFAQTVSAGGSGGLTGTVGVVGEAYSASGIANRRDAASGMVFGRAASTAGELRYGFRFMLTTEQTGSRQAMNRMSVNLAYRIAGITIGDLSPVLSEFSVNGATIRGGSAELSYGPYLATFMYGRVRRSTNPTGEAVFGRRSFAQWLYATRIGAGRSTASHAHLIGVVARDDDSSVSDSLQAAPTENVSITPDVGLSLFEDRLNVRATYTLAAYSADTRATATSAGVSSMLGFFTPRVGSRLDYATDVSARLRLREFKMRASFERVQPGFKSLGLSQIRSDRSIIRIDPSVSFADRKANVHARFRSSRNNLAGNRSATLRRRLIGLHGYFRLSPRVNLAAAYSNVNTRNELEVGLTSLAAGDQRNVAHTLMLGPTFTVSSARRTHVVNLNATYQFLRDRTASGSTLTPEVKFDNVSTTVAYSIAFPTGVSMNVSAGLLSSKTPATDASAVTLSAGTSTALLKRRGRLAIQGGWSRNSLDFAGEDAESLSSRQLSLRVSGSYRIPAGNTLQLSARGLRNSGDLTGSFNELQVSVRVERRF